MMIKRVGFLALIPTVAGAVLPATALAQDGYYGAGQGYGQSYGNSDRRGQDFRRDERQERRLEERWDRRRYDRYRVSEWRAREWRDQEFRNQEFRERQRCDNGYDRTDSLYFAMAANLFKPGHGRCV